MDFLTHENFKHLLNFLAFIAILIAAYIGIFGAFGALSALAAVRLFNVLVTGKSSPPPPAPGQ